MFYKENHIIIRVKIKYRLDFTPNYVFVLDGKCYNQKTGRFVKQSMKGGSIGYYIDGYFWSYSSLKQHIKKPD